MRWPVEHVLGNSKRFYDHQRVRFRILARKSIEIRFKLLAYRLRRADRLLIDAPAPPERR